MLRRWLFAITVAACGPSVAISGQRIRPLADTPSGKHVAVYQSSSFATERHDVPEDVVIQAMRASSMFFEEDIRALAPKIAPELGKLDPDQRVVVATNDTAIYMFVSTGELQIVGYREGQEVSRHASPIPTAAVKTELTPRPRPTPAPAPAPTPVPAEVRTTPVVEVAPARPAETQAKPVAIAPGAGAVVRPDPRPRPASTKPRPVAPPAPAKTGPRLTEGEIRAKLDELDHLRAKDLITQEEYEKKKKALLDQL